MDLSPLPRALPVALAALLLGACRDEEATQLEVRTLLDPGPDLVKVAGMMPGDGPSERLLAATALAKTVSAGLTQRQGKASAHVDIRTLPPDAARAIDLVMGALEAHETWPRVTTCSDGIEDAVKLGQLLDLTSPPGDEAQLDAVMWLGTRLREDRPGALGTLAGLTLAANTVQLARARGLPVWSGFERHWVPPHFVLVAYAREAICTLDRLNAAGAQADAKVDALIVKEGKALRQLRIRTVEDAIPHVKDPERLLRHLREAEDAAIRSDKELVRLQALGEAPWRDIEAARQVIDGFAREMGAPRPRPRSSAPPPPAGRIRGALLAALVEAVWVGREGEGVRALGLASDKALYGLGLRNGDRVTEFAGAPVPHLDALKARIERAPEGVAMMSLVRRGAPMTLRFDLEWTPQAGADEAAANTPPTAFPGVTVLGPDQFAVSFAGQGQAIIDMLEHSTQFRFVPLLTAGQLSSLRVVGVRRDTLAAALGLRSGDVIHTFNGAPIDQEFLRRSFKGQRAGTVLTFGLTRSGAERVLTWSLQ